MDPSDNRATIIFVLGVLGIFVCQILAPVAWVMGNAYNRDCILEGSDTQQLGNVGRIMGIIGTALLAFYLLTLAAICVLYLFGI